MICLKRSVNTIEDRSIHEIWKKRLFTDVRISCHGTIIGVHKALLASTSSYLSSLFNHLQNFDDCVLILDGFGCKEVENLVKLIYEGEVSLNYQDFGLLKELIRALRIEKIVPAVGSASEMPVTAPGDNLDAIGVSKLEVMSSNLYVEEMENNSDQECSFFDDRSMSHVEIGDPLTGETDQSINLTSRKHGDMESLTVIECEEHVEEIGDIVIKTTRRSSDNYRSSKYTCERCKLEFATVDMLEEHALKHVEGKRNVTEDPDVQCPLCLEVFETMEQFNLHTKVFHEELTCQICNVVLSAKRMKGHMKQEHDVVESQDGKVTYCCLCKKIFTKSQYQIHYARMHANKSKEPRDTAPVQCPYCNKKFSSAHLNYHVRLNHSTVPVFNCNQCKKIFKTKGSRDEHKDFCLKATTVCNFCNEMYRPVYRKTHLMRHAREECANVSPDEEGLFRCPRCDRKFEHKLFVENHMFGHLWPRCKYECSSCASMFILKKQIDAHVEKCEEEIETSLKRFASRPTRPVMRSAWTPEERKLGKVCPVCSKRVKSSAWASHLNNHQKVNGEVTEQFSCNACEKTFFRKSDVEKHITLKHRKDGKKICSKCKKLFSSAYELQLHRVDCKKVYTKVCPICNNEIDLFQRINHLKAHAEEEIENYENPSCPRCGRAFENFECLINHLLNHYEPFREFECDLCLLGFKTRIILEKHKTACTGPETKSGPSKKRSWNLGIKKEQTDVLQWKCPVCSVLFKTEQECSDHIYQMHSEEKTVDDDGDQVMSVFT